MGRGNSDKTGPSGRQLLFGQRQPKNLSPEQQRQLTNRQRQRTRDARRRQHLQALTQATGSFFSGNAQPLTEILSRDAPYGTIETERQQLRELSYRLRSHFRGQPPPPISHQQIDALQQLRRRAVQRKLSDNYQEVLWITLAEQAGRMVYDDITERLDRASEEIGALPRIWSNGRSTITHLQTENGDLLLCGGPRRETPTPLDPLADRGLATPLSRDLTCPDCLQHYQAGTPAQSYQARDWLKLWHDDRDRQIRAIEHQIPQIFGWNGPPTDVAAEDIHHRILEERLQRLTKQLADYGLAIPSLLSPDGRP